MTYKNMKFIFCGDFVSQNPNGINVDGNLKKLLCSADFVAVNFEAPIRGKGTPIYKSGPSLTQSEVSPSFIENLGVNIIMMANNHMMDQDVEGCKFTIEKFSSETIVIGAGYFNDVYQIHVVEKNGVKIGLFCFVHKEFGALGIDSKNTDYGTAWISQKIIPDILELSSSSDLILQSKKETITQPDILVFVFKEIYESELSNNEDFCIKIIIYMIFFYNFIVSRYLDIIPNFNSILLNYIKKIKEKNKLIIIFNTVQDFPLSSDLGVFLLNYEINNDYFVQLGMNMLYYTGKYYDIFKYIIKTRGVICSVLVVSIANAKVKELIERCGSLYEN